MNFDVGDRVVVIDTEYGFLIGQVGTVREKPESHYLQVEFESGAVYMFASEQLKKTVKVNRYLLFAGQQYYPKGDWDDLVGSYETLTEAAKAGLDQVEPRMGNLDDWFRVVDLYSGIVVAQHGRKYGQNYED